VWASCFGVCLYHFDVLSVEGAVDMLKDKFPKCTILRAKERKARKGRLSIHENARNGFAVALRVGTIIATLE
jgi:hypothetical protein